ncbi:NAD(P)-dependent oxidoreductase [Halomonas denitrificans]|nr:glyoxylate/hydroxypyruvate reductase A [Halomonas denitrificans]
MALLLIAPDRDTSELERRLRGLDPDLDLRRWPDVGRPGDVVFALAWKPPAEAFAGLPALRAVGSLGAGVDHLVDRPDLADDLALTRLAGPRLAADLAAYLVAMTVDWWKRLDEQRHCPDWRPLEPRSTPRIGLLGTGAMGRTAARAFRTLELDVAGWNRSGAACDSMATCSGADGLTRLAGRSDVLINVLPLTPATRGLLDGALFEQMPSDSLLVNVGRGEHLVEADLLDALERNRPGRAVLDVFGEEPLPADHPFRRHPRVVVTPHIAARTDAAEAARLALEQYRAIRRGDPPPGRVDRARGY